MAVPIKPPLRRAREPRPPLLPGRDVERREERLIALFILGCVLFSPLILNIFHGAQPFIAGMPRLFLYLFGAWAALIAAVAIVVEIQGRPQGSGEPAPGSPRALEDGPRR